LDLYGAIVFVHATTILLFFIAHGTSIAVAFQLKRESEPARVRALLDLSRVGIGLPAIILVLLGLASGILAGFLGDWWGTYWIWISIVLFLGVGGAMTPMAAKRLGAIRTAAGLGAVGGDAEPPPAEDREEMRRLIEAWNPMPIAAMGLVGFIVILWLMMAKPF
jgi:small-conductance mechanosensitive channel